MDWFVQHQAGFHLYYCRRRMQMNLHTSVFTIGRKISTRVRNSTPIIAYVRLRLAVRNIWTDHFLRLSFAFLRKKDFMLPLSRLMSPRPPRARHAHRAHATPTARKALRQGRPYILNCKQQKAVRAVVEW